MRESPCRYVQMLPRSVNPKENRIKLDSVARLGPGEIRGWGISNPPFSRPQVDTRRKAKEVRDQEASPRIMHTHMQQSSTSVPAWRSLPRAERILNPSMALFQHICAEAMR